MAGEFGSEDPVRHASIETGVGYQPMPDEGLSLPHGRGNPGNPPAVDLERAKIMASVRIADLSTNPSPLLIPQPPKRALYPRHAMRGRANTGCNCSFCGRVPIVITGSGRLGYH